MADDKKFTMNMNLLQHFDAAVEDENASLKDSDRYVELTSLTKKYSEGVPLNEGGMKKIIHCRDLYTDRDVAMAVPKDDLDGEGIDRFIEEARITASLEHSNIVPVHELSVDAGRPFFTMKILGGENLGDVIKNIDKEAYRAKYTTQTMLDIFLKVCDAIAFAHAQGVLHLDIKPSNIQINEYGEVLVCDWGLAQYLDQKRDGSKKIIGTPGYMSPELINGEQVTESSDIFSLGALLYTMLLHRMAFSGSESETVKRHVLCGEMQEPLELPASLRAVVLKALSLDASKRYKDCSEMAEDVRAYLNGFATSAEDASFLTLVFLLIKRYKVMFATVVVFLVIISTVTTAFIADLNFEKKNALKAKEEALIAQSNAELARDVAKVAEEDSMQVRKSAAPNFLKYARREFSVKEYHKAYRLTQKAIELDPDFRNAKVYMVNLLIGRHQFTEAAELISILGNEEQFAERLQFIKLCQDLLTKGPLHHQVELLPTLKNMSRMKSVPGIRAHFLYWMTKSEYPLEDRLHFARSYLESITVGKFRFDLSGEGEELKLSLARNNGMYTIMVLHNLPIVELNLSKTSVFDLKPLEGMKLRKLDVSHTDALELSFLAKCPLVELNIYNCNVKHINKLDKTPLEVITLNNRWFNIAELEGFKFLRELRVPKGYIETHNIEKLKQKYKVIEFQ